MSGPQGRPFGFKVSMLGARKNETVLKYQNFYLKKKCSMSYFWGKYIIIHMLLLLAKAVGFP